MNEKNLEKAGQLEAVPGAEAAWYKVSNGWINDPCHIAMECTLTSSDYYRAVTLEHMLRAIASKARRGGAVCAENGVAYTVEMVARVCRLQTGDVQAAIDDLMDAGIITQDDAGTFTIPDVAKAAGAQRKRDSRERTKARTADKKAAAELQAQVDALFDRWYAVYPRKENKSAARKAWSKMAKENGLDLLDDVVTATQVLLDRPGSCLRRDDPRYIPLPSSYLNGRRYEDAMEA